MEKDGEEMRKKEKNDVKDWRGEDGREDKKGKGQIEEEED